MSWIDELAPLRPTVANLWADLRATDAAYRTAGLGRRERAAFAVLRLTQRVAYWAGWQAGGPWRPGRITRARAAPRS